MSTVSIHPVSTTDSLHCHYDRQTNAQPCFIELDCETGRLCADYNGEIGNAIPMSVYHGHDQRWGIPALTAAAANALLQEIAPIAQRVVDGYESEWDGNNMVARFNDDAHAAIDEIVDLCQAAGGEGYEIVEWDVGDWMDSSPRPNAETSDDEIAQMVADSDPDEDHIVINGDIEEYLNEIRYEKRRETIEEIFDDRDSIDEYRNLSSKNENPVYLVRFLGGGCIEVFYNAAGKIVYRRTKIDPIDTSDVEIGVAYCDLYRKTKPQGGTMPRSRPIMPATAYDAARCDAVPERYRRACKQVAERSLYDAVQKKFRAENAAYFENKKQRTEIAEKIADLERQINNLRHEMPPEMQPEYFSMATDADACRYNNLVGHFPKIEK